MSDLEHFYDSHVDKVYKFFYIQCLDQQTAEDLTSQTFLSLIDATSNGAEIDKPKKYLYGIMRNTWAGFLRNKYKHQMERLEEIEDFQAYTEEVIDEYESQSVEDRALHFINKLPKRQKEIARLRYIDELTPGEIATKLGKSKSYVKTTHNRALKSLRKLMEEIGGATS